jgi:Domain of Unknown Function (DUF1206)
VSGQERDLGDKAQDAAREVADSRWVDRVSRAGLAARAVIYLMVGYLAGRIALGAAGVGQASTARPASGGGALEALAEHPGGRVALALLALGFLGYALLGLVQAGFRHQDIDNPAERRGKRLFFAGVALLYAAFFLYTASLLLQPGSGQQSTSGSRAQETELTARVLSWPYGRLLVGGVGAVLVIAGLGFGYQAVSTNFQERLKRERMGPAIWWSAIVLGAVGSWARAVVLVLVGVFVIAAAVTFDPDKARGLDASLRTVAGQPYGPWVLGAVALGLICYGAYVLIETVYRKV